jgi:hypothetical protein
MNDDVAARIRAELTRGSLHLAPPMTKRDVTAFETHHGVSLPSTIASS